MSSFRRRPPHTRSSARGSTPSPRRRSAARTSSCLRVTPQRPSPRSGKATRRSATSARSATVLRSRRCSPGRCKPAVTLSRRTSSSARWRRLRPSTTSGRRRSTASPAHDSSSMPAGLTKRSGSRGRRSRSSSPRPARPPRRRPARACGGAALGRSRRRRARVHPDGASCSTRRRGTLSPSSAPGHSSSSRLRRRDADPRGHRRIDRSARQRRHV